MKSFLHPEDRDEVLGRLDGLRPDAHRLWGRMSVGGMVCHLGDSFLAVLGDRGARRTPKLHERTLMRWFAVSAPLPWPKGVPTMPASDQEKEGTPPGDFDEDKARLRTVAERFLSEVDTGKLEHPVFGRMSRAEWGRWAYRHMNHHLRQFSA